MKKLLSGIILSLLLIGVCFAANPNIRTTENNTAVITGFNFIQMSGINVPASTSNALTFYLDNIGSARLVDFYITGVSTGSAITTCSMQSVYPNGTNLTTAQTLTSGTDLTAIKSAYYKLTIPAATVTRNVSLNILVAF